MRKKSSKNLVIQTAKIGDYVNSTVIFDKIAPFDIIIDKVNYPLAIYDKRIGKIYIIQNYKKNILSKIKFGFMLFFQNYHHVYVLVPNSFNLFLAKFTFSKIYTIKHYANKWYEILLMINTIKIDHTKENLTIQSYLKMVNENDLEKNWKSLPLIKPKNNLINSKKFKVGISLSAGNKLKTIDTNTWCKIFEILSTFDIEIYIFGLKEEEKFLQSVKKCIKNPSISLLGKIKLEHLPFYISQMNLYISSDTGNSYIADTFKIPIINFAGPCYTNEQCPINENVLIVQSNAKCVPFSSVFKTIYKSKCKELYEINKSQEKTIKDFITRIYKDFQFFV